MGNWSALPLRAASNWVNLSSRMSPTSSAKRVKRQRIRNSLTDWAGWPEAKAACQLGEAAGDVARDLGGAAAGVERQRVSPHRGEALAHVRVGQILQRDAV